MGNKDSKSNHHHVAEVFDSSTSEPKRNWKLEKAYKLWTDQHGGVTRNSFERVFGQVLGPKLWRYLKGSSDNDDNGNVSLEEFDHKFIPFVYGSSDEIYFRVLAGEDGRLNDQDITEAIHICRATAGIDFKESTDEKLIKAIISTLKSGNEKIDLNQLRNWIENTCPRLISSLKRTVTNGIQTANTHCDEWCGPKSRLLSPMQIWLMQCCVPSYLIRPEASSISEQLADAGSFPSCAPWDLLYSSEDDGLSPNRFETKVFNYKSPTVMVVETLKKELFCLCVDEEWKFSTQRWGKSGCAIYIFQPRVELLESGGVNGMIFFNTKQRGLPQGLFVGSNPKNPYFNIDPDFSNVRSMEVWGCGSTDSYLAQQNHRQWEKRQVEKQQKVPLPTKEGWEDNPDRLLLDMAGIKTQHAEK